MKTSSPQSTSVAPDPDAGQQSPDFDITELRISQLSDDDLQRLEKLVTPVVKQAGMTLPGNDKLADLTWAAAALRLERKRRTARAKVDAAHAELLAVAGRAR